MKALQLSEGHEFPAVEVPAISRGTLARFAGASGDYNPMHIDIDVARAAGRDDVFAHGMLSMAYLGRALNGWVPQDRLRRFNVRFVAITPVHGQPTCRATVTGTRDEGDARLAVLELSVVLADGTVTLRGQAEVVLDPVTDKRASGIASVD